MQFDLSTIRIKKLMARIKYVYLKDIESKLLTDLYNEDFKKNFKYELLLFESRNNKKNIEEINSEEPKLEKNKFAHELYLRIAKETHPDIHRDPVKTEYFIEAKRLYKKNDIFSLIVLCDQLNITIKKIPEKEKNLIEEQINSTLDKIDNLKNSYAWIWYTNDDKEKVKNFIMEDMNITKEDLDEFIKNIKP